MELHLTPDQETQLSEIASRTGIDAEHLVQDAVAHFLEEVRFREAVELGESQLERGEYLTHAQVGERIKRFLQS